MAYKVPSELKLQCLCSIYDAGLPHPPSPPPTPWYPPLPVKWVVVLFGLVAFPVWSCLASSPLPPPPLWSGACGLFGWPRPACCRYVPCPLPPPGPAPPVWGSVSTKICMVWPLPLVSSNVIVTCSIPYKIALFSLQTVPLSLLSPSSPPSGSFRAGSRGGSGARRGRGGVGGDTMGGGGGVGARDPRAHTEFGLSGLSRLGSTDRVWVKPWIFRGVEFRV